MVAIKTSGAFDPSVVEKMDRAVAQLTSGIYGNRNVQQYITSALKSSGIKEITAEHRGYVIGQLNQRYD